MIVNVSKQATDIIYGDSDVNEALNQLLALPRIDDIDKAYKTGNYYYHAKSTDSFYSKLTNPRCIVNVYGYIDEYGEEVIGEQIITSFTDDNYDGDQYVDATAVLRRGFTYDLNNNAMVATSTWDEYVTDRDLRYKLDTNYTVRGAFSGFSQGNGSDFIVTIPLGKVYPASFTKVLLSGTITVRDNTGILINAKTLTNKQGGINGYYATFDILVSELGVSNIANNHALSVWITGGTLTFK